MSSPTLPKTSRPSGCLRAFRTDRRGHVAITFGFALLPLVGFLGAAVDYSRAAASRTALQSAIDATALMLSKNAATLTSAQLQQQATAILNTLYNQQDAANIQVSATYSTSGGSQVTVNASASLSTYFMRALGTPNMTITASSTTKWGLAKLRVAMALDNTGSMADDGKMPALKTATKNMLTTLKNAAAKNGDIYVAIIPFSKDVNVGVGNKNQSWMDFSDHGSTAGWDSLNGSCNKSSWFFTPQTKSACTLIGGTWTPDSHDTWNGCVTDRDQDYDISNTTPTPTIQGTRFMAEQYSSCPLQMKGQTYDWTALSSLVDSMYPAGNTNQSIGLVWAWHALTEGAPMNPPTISTSDAPDTQKIIILMSDGLNTQNRYTSTAALIDARQATLCTAIKNAGVTIYTVQVNTGGDPLSTVLQGCASDSSKFFQVTTATQIVNAFNAITTSMAQLRIAK